MRTMKLTDLHRHTLNPPAKPVAVNIGNIQEIIDPNSKRSYWGTVGATHCSACEVGRSHDYWTHLANLSTYACDHAK